MNIVFFGSAQFAVPSLKILLGTHHKVSAAVTQPDRHKGRGLAIASTPVKSVAEEAGLKVYQPESINTLEAAHFLKGLGPDLFVVIAYGQIISQKLLDIPRLLAVNVHASLLPKYRGAAPINWAIINGETTTGVTVMKMVRQMDAGPVIAQEKISIDNDDNARTLERKLSDLGAHLLLQSLKSIENGRYALLPQDDAKVVLASKLRKEDGLIKWDVPAQDIYNRIRGCVGWPGAFTHYEGKLMKIYRARVAAVSHASGRGRPGEIIKISREGISVYTAKDILIIEELQIEGRKRMDAAQFISGYKVAAGKILGKAA
ncbi:MAG: methionyl-tRNA formyltransferase [Deltaproteobacteria bacterium]